MTPFYQYTLTMARPFPVRGTHGWRQWRVSGLTVLDEWQTIRHTWRARMAAELWCALYGARR